MAEKLTVAVKVWMTETEFNALSRVCSNRDRSASEYMRVHLLRPHLFGIVPRGAEQVEWANSASADLNGPERG